MYCEEEFKSIIIESRSGQISSAETDIATNFYLCSNDREDAYKLEMYRDLSCKKYKTIIPEKQAQVILQSVVQNPYTKAAGITMTQYTAHLQ